MKKENWQDSEKKYEILVDDTSPLARADLRRSGLTLSDTDDGLQEDEAQTTDAENTSGVTVRRVLIAAAVLCISGVLGVVAGFGIGGIFRQKHPQKPTVSDSSQVESETSSQPSPQEEEEPTVQQEPPKEVKFDINKTVSVKNTNLTVLNGTYDGEMMYFTMEMACPASLIGKSSGKVVNPYVNVQLLPDETKLNIDSLEMLERQGSSFTVKTGFRLPHKPEKGQEVHVDFYGLSVSREKINPKTGTADVVCNIRQRTPSTVSFVYDE